MLYASFQHHKKGGYIIKTFVKDMLERAIKTAAQSAIAAIGTATVMEGVNWTYILSITGMATVMSVLTSIASANFGEKGTAGMVDLHTNNK